MILLLTYDKMIEHAKGASKRRTLIVHNTTNHWHNNWFVFFLFTFLIKDLKEKAIEVMVQQAKICIEIRNYTKSLSILHDVEILIKVGPEVIII